MFLAPLIPCPYGGTFPWGVTHSGVRPYQFALLYVGVLALWVQLEMVAERGCLGVISLGLTKIMAASYFCAVL